MAPPASSGAVTSAWGSAVRPRLSVSRSRGSSTPPFWEGHSPQKCAVPSPNPECLRGSHELCSQPGTAQRQGSVLRDDVSLGRCASIVDGTSTSLAGAASHPPGCVTWAAAPVQHVPARNSTRLTQAQEETIRSRGKREACEAAARVTRRSFTVNFFL